MRSLFFTNFPTFFRDFWQFIFITKISWLLLQKKKSSENFGITKRRLWKDCYSMSSNVVFRTHQDNHPKRSRPPKPPYKTSEQIKSFWGSFKLIKQASKSKRKPSETNLTNLKIKMVVGCPYVIINTWKPCKIHLYMSIGTKGMLLWKSSKCVWKNCWM